MEQAQTQEMTIAEFFQKAYDLFGNKVKLKYNHTTKGDTWEITVRAANEVEALKLVEWINERMSALKEA